jgi:hypothetical protein
MAEAYYIEKNGSERDGPYLLDGLKRHLLAGEMTEKTLVWKEGMAGWEEAGKVAAFQPLIAEARAEIREREAEQERQAQKAAAARLAEKAEQERQAQLVQMAAQQQKLEQKKAAAGGAVKRLIILGIILVLLYVFARPQLLGVIEDLKEVFAGFVG